jgi:sulfatase maturation enzyme AslB (radical SAM superfamily)
LVHALIELTNKCNFHCDFCPSDSQRRQLDFIDKNLIRQVYDEIAEKKLVQQVSLHLMGEPTLHPQLQETLDYASARNIKTELVTNGSTLNAKMIPRILDSLYGLLVVSLQTPTQDTFKHRGDTGLSWDRYIAGIRLLVREYLKRQADGKPSQCTLVLRVMVTNNSKLPSAIIETWDDVGQVMHEWSRFVAAVEAELGMAPFRRNEISPKTFETMVQRNDINYSLQHDLSLCFWQGFTFANSMVNADCALEPNPSANFCIHPFVDVGVLSNGDVTLCCLDYEGELAVGNVKDSTVEAILKGKPAKDLRAAMLGDHPLPSFCQKCQSKVVPSPKSNR